MTNGFSKTIFFPPKNAKLAKQISIRTPLAFKGSITRLQAGGLTLEEFRALKLAQTRAKLQLRRLNLSPRERKQMRTISLVRIPPPTR